jgi:hypothetical protein
MRVVDLPRMLWECTAHPNIVTGKGTLGKGRLMPARAYGHDLSCVGIRSDASASARSRTVSDEISDPHVESNLSTSHGAAAPGPHHRFWNWLSRPTVTFAPRGIWGANEARQ